VVEKDIPYIPNGSQPSPTTPPPLSVNVTMESAKAHRLKGLEKMCESSSKSEEASLITLAQEADRLMAVHKQLADKLGADPDLNFWAEQVGIPKLMLERKVLVGMKAKQELVQRNLGLVRKALGAYQGKSGPGQGLKGMTYTDLEQEGVFGLVRAVEKFDLSSGHAFSTYATIWIKNMMQHAVAGNDRAIRIPTTTLQEVKKVQAARQALTDLLERRPTEKEMAKRLGWSLQHLRKYDVYTQVISSDQEAFSRGAGGDGGPPPSIAAAAQDKEAAEAAARRADAGGVAAFLRRHLEEVEVRVITLRFGLDGEGAGPGATAGGGQGRSLAACGELLGYSAEHVRRKEKAGLAKLQAACAAGDGCEREELLMLAALA